MGSGLSSTHHHRRSSSSAAASSRHRPPAPPPAAAPALVVAPDGSLREFAPAPCPACAADALAAFPGADAGRFFLCSADALYFGADVPALEAGEPLRSGQIYFVLPAAALARPLSSADMAALAVRASDALAARAAAAQRGGRRGRGRARGGFAKARVVPAPYADGDEEVNEKLNQRTLGGFFETASLGQARNAGAKPVAAAVRPPMRRALSTIEEDAE